MRAIVVERHGGPEVLRLADLPEPVPGEGQVLVRVVAAGVSRLDAEYRAGTARFGVVAGVPFVPGGQAAGSVEGFGAGGSGRFRKGDRVWISSWDGGGAGGCYAELVAVPESGVAPMPARLLFEEAAAVPLAGTTAWRALRGDDGARRADSVLVVGAAGGVGSLALSLALDAGMTLVAALRTEHFGFALERGATGVVDPRREPLAAAARRYAPDGVGLVLDCVGGAVGTAALGALRPGGRFVALAPGVEDAAAAGVTIERPEPAPTPGLLTRLAALVDTRALQPTIDRIHPLADAAAAHARLDAGGQRGTQVLNL